MEKNKTSLWKAHILIYRDGRDTTAKLKFKTVLNGKTQVREFGTGVAHCNPTDKFDMFLGSQIALQRLAAATLGKVVTVPVPIGVPVVLEPYKL
jgi:hypothetical protein